MAEFDYESNVVGKRMMTASPHSAGEVHVNTGRAALDVACVASDLVGLCILPAGCVPVDFKLKSEALDVTTSSIAVAMTVSIGISKADKSALASSTTIIATNTLARAGGEVGIDAANMVFQGLRAKNKDRTIAALIAAGAGHTSSATNATAGELMGELFYRAVEDGEWDANPSSIA